MARRDSRSAPASNATRTERLAWWPPAFTHALARLRRPDGRATYLAVALEPTDDKSGSKPAPTSRHRGAPRRLVGGAAVAQEQVNKQVEEDLREAEMLAFPLLFLLSFVFFRSLVASRVWG